jgi:NADH-quinone oxidoreductase subunit D
MPETGLQTREMLLNMGPSHPSTHGVLRITLEMDGEVCRRATPHVGFLHRGFEKLAENMTYHQFIPYTDRLDYLAPLSNNTAYALAVEKLLGLEVPPRAKAIRVLVSELARISSHLLGVGTWIMDVGALTVFFYTFQEREHLYDLFEMLTGARLTTSYTRVGGVAFDLPDGFGERTRAFLDRVPAKADELENLISTNRIWRDRTVGVGVIPAERAVALSLTGPNLRASGVPWDLRKEIPYLGYEQYDFDVPVGRNGDCYDRYLVRVEEMRQSARIARQALDRMPEGPVCCDAPDVVLPPKEKVYTKMEELIRHFKIVSGGVRAPAGEIYASVENPKGELGFYIVSDGASPFAHRMRIRSPSFVNIQALETLLPGHKMADVVCIIGSLDFVMGECDR